MRAPVGKDESITVEPLGVLGVGNEVSGVIKGQIYAFRLSEWESGMTRSLTDREKRTCAIAAMPEPR